MDFPGYDQRPIVVAIAGISAMNSTGAQRIPLTCNVFGAILVIALQSPQKRLCNAFGKPG
jgi:hypothetical protein